MKKIAEIQIGANVPDYVHYGSPTLFVNYTETAKFKFQWGNYCKGALQAYCDYCHRIFIVNRSDSFDAYEIMTCPSCGRTHKHNQIMYSPDSYGIMPYKIRIALIEFNGKIELRLKYQGICFNEDIFNEWQHFSNVYEKYIFDLANSKVTWQRQADKEHLEYEIGYFNEDFETLKSKSALCFLQYDHKIKKGDSFTGLLKKLREAVNRLAVRQGYQPKKLYITGKRRTRLFANILNIAHRVKFWDSENAAYTGKTDFPYYLQKNKITKKYLDMSIVEFWQKQGYGYQEALLKTLNLPNIKVVRREVKFANIYNLMLAFKPGRNIDISRQMYEYFRTLDNAGYDRYYEQDRDKNKLEAIKIYEAISSRFTDLTFVKMINKYDYYKDIYYLLGRMDKINKEEYFKSKISLRKLHDWLSVKIAEQKDREIIFDIPDHILKRLDMQLSHYNLQTITKNSQLLKVAKGLKNCCAGYRNTINEKRQLVVITDDIGKMKALLEITGNHIVQAKLFDNKCVNKQKEINDLIINFAEKTGLNISTRDVDTVQDDVEIAQIA